MKWKISLSLATILFLTLVSLALAHGVVISYEATENGEIELQAVFDTGEVMSEAQVSIFSPEDPATPWLTGTADEEGRFSFTPDQPGTWDVQFRKAGHGDIVHIMIEEIIEVDVMEEDTLESVEEPQAGDETAAETQERAAAAESEAQAADGESEAEAADTAAVVDDDQEAQADVEVEAATDVSETVNNNDTNEETVTETETEAAAETAETTESAAPPTTQRLVIANSGSDGLTTSQILLMSGSVIWGFIGTALFFARGRSS